MSEAVFVSCECCCCGEGFEAGYKRGDETGKAFAEACDVCPKCHQARCDVLSGEYCNVTGTVQREVREMRRTNLPEKHRLEAAVSACLPHATTVGNLKAVLALLRAVHLTARCGGESSSETDDVEAVLNEKRRP